MPAPSNLSLHRAALSPIHLGRPRSCEHGAHTAQGVCAIEHNSVGSYSVMLLAVAIVVLGIVVLAVTWRRGRTGTYRADARDE